MKGSLKLNIIASVIQTIFSAILLFALYRYINISLGVDKLGIWAIVVSTTSASRLVDFGLSMGVTRFVARDKAKNDFCNVVKTIDTAIITVWAVVGILLPILYPVIKLILSHVLNNKELVEAIEILPFSLLSLWLSIGSTIFIGGLAGCQRIDIQAGLVIIGQILLLIFTVGFVPAHGLNGVVYAQICQALYLLIAGRLLLRRELIALPLLPYQWSKKSFKELLGYGANLQIGTVSQLIFDVVTKLLLAKYGGATSVGYFEIANQLVAKIRIVIVSANQAVIPFVTNMHERNPAELYDFYSINMQAIIFFTLPVFAIVFSWTGLFSWLFIGKYQIDFAVVLHLICIGWFVNIFAAPAYFINMGTGELKWNVWSHLIMAVLIIVLGVVLGGIFGETGVVLAYALSIIIGSLALIWFFHKNNIKNITANYKNVKINILKSNIKIIAGSIFIIISALISPVNPVGIISASMILQLVIPLFLIIVLMWSNEMRLKIFRTK